MQDFSEKVVDLLIWLTGSDTFISQTSMTLMDGICAEEYELTVYIGTTTPLGVNVQGALEELSAAGMVFSVNVERPFDDFSEPMSSRSMMFRHSSHLSELSIYCNRQFLELIETYKAFGDL